MQTSLVGDLILGLREMATDPCLSLSPPSNVAAVPSPTGSVNIWIVATQLTPWGESAASIEVALSNAALNSTFTVTGNCSYSATAIRVYFSLIGSGQEDRFISYAVQAGGIGAFSISFSLSSSGITGGWPPQISRAWLPDTDGTAISAVSLYRWLNEGLDAATAITEGIRDITGIPSVAGQAQYQVIGNWRKMSNGFFDGYPFGFGSKFDIFRHANVTGITGTMVMNQDSYVQQVEVWPQANRTSGQGTLSSAMGATDTTLNYTPGSNGFVLGFGLALLGPYPADPSQCEIVYYSGFGNGSQLVDLQRGQGGTSPQAWPIGTLVTELNIYLSGTRTPTHYAQGQSALTLALPPAWIDAIRAYLQYRFKDAEQDVQGAEAKLKEFNAKCQTIRGTRAVMGPRQISINGAGSGVETVYGAGSAFGGVIMP